MGILEIVMEKAVEPFLSKPIDFIKNVFGQHNDVKLGNAIHQGLLDHYGNEPFYHDFDSYLTRCKTIDGLILTLRRSLPSEVIESKAFVDQNFKQLLDEAPRCLAYSAQIKDALSQIYNGACFAIQDTNHYSDFGRLLREIRINHAENRSQFRAILSILSDIRDRMLSHQNASAPGPAGGALERDNVSASDNRLVPGLFIINRETVTAYKTGIDSLPIQAYRRISANIKNILYAVCSDMIKECRLEDTTATLVDFVRNEVLKESQAVFLLGNGGIGKSTTLVRTAVRLCDSGNNIYLFQLGGGHDQEIICQVLERIASRPEQKHILFIDNPYDNSEGTRDLLDKIQDEINVQVVISERLNRFESIAEDILPDLYFASAKIIVPVLKREKIPIKKFDGNKILMLQISHEWKREVVLQMFRSISNVDMPRIESILKGQNQMSVIEWYLRTCIEYNKWVDAEDVLATRCKVKLDWDEWRELFHTPHPRFSEDDAKKLRELFRVVAALDIFKIKASTKLLAQESKIDAPRLDSILRSTLNTASNEPAIYENDSEYPYVALKHDMISTLFFEVEEENPQLILEHIVNLLGADTEAVVSFEKQVFKRKYIMHGNEAPFNINTKKLYQIFAQHPSYYEILRERHRTYSFDIAEIWQQDERGNETAISGMWDRVLNLYKFEEPQIKEKVFMCCLDDCQRRSIPLPKTLLTEKSSVMALSVAIAQRDLPGIAAAWKARFSQLFRCGIAETTLIPEWNRAILDYLLYGFDMPEEFFSILTYADYRVIDAAYARLEYFVRCNRLNKCRYYKLGILLYKEIADHHSRDISSRMRLAHCYIQSKELGQAESTYREILELYPDHVQANNALGTLCAQRLKDEWKELESDAEEKKRLVKVCNSSLERAIELAEKGEDKSICYGAMGTFLYRAMRAYQESYHAFQTALEYHEQASIHSQLGMLCCNYHKDNPCFSIDEAKFHFDRAISLLKSNDLDLLSVYVPYANLHYSLGTYDKAIALYQKAEKLGEQKATKMLKKIQDEREELAKLGAYPRTTMITLETAYNLTCGDPAVFDNEQNMNEIFSLLLNSMEDEGKTHDDIKRAINIVQNFRRSNSRYKYGIIAMRVIQKVESAAISHDIYKTNAERIFRMQCFFIWKSAIEPAHGLN